MLAQRLPAGDSYEEEPYGGTSGRKSRGREHKRSTHGLPGKTRNPTYERTNSSCRNRKMFGPPFGVLEYFVSLIG